MWLRQSSLFFWHPTLYGGIRSGTTEVIYARPISNGEYVAGKTLGIMSLFVGLVFVVLLIALVFNLILKDSPVVWEAYVLYPLLISIPTLTFILGLSFFLMILFRNQAVTFVILLGYIGLTLFYFKDKMHGLLDYMVFNFPLVYSDFIQFADLDNILLHRLAYFLLGLGFIFATIRFLGRLPQTGKWNFINLAAFLVLVSLGFLAGYKYYSGYRIHELNRTKYVRLNNKYAASPFPDILSNNISVVQDGRRLTVSSEVFLRNQNYSPLDTLIFSLNPGFRIDSIISRDGAVEYLREQQILRIIPKTELGPGRRTSYSFYYKGIPEEDLAYLDIPKKELAKLKRIQVATLDKKAAILNEKYILLTGELFWYPEAGVGFNNLNYEERQRDFVRYNLSVRPEKGLTPVAPGRMEEKDGAVVFSQDNDLNTLPLVIGPFEKKSISIDNVEYNLFFKPDHDYCSQYFPTISDTLSSLITEAKENYEYDEIDLYYSFKRVSLVEVPIQFHPYERPYTQLVDYIQPEIIFIPEKGAGITTLDFKRNKRGEENRNKERDNT